MVRRRAAARDDVGSIQAATILLVKKSSVTSKFKRTSANRQVLQLEMPPFPRTRIGFRCRWLPIVSVRTLQTVQETQQPLGTRPTIAPPFIRRDVTP
jgi:hypothetical protein